MLLFWQVAYISFKLGNLLILSQIGLDSLGYQEFLKDKGHTKIRIGKSKRITIREDKRKRVNKNSQDMREEECVGHREKW